MPLAQRAAEEMRQQIFQADLNRKENKALTELELEAQDRAQCLVERASSLRMEQEEELRLLNKVGSTTRFTTHDAVFVLYLYDDYQYVCVCVLSPQLILDAQCQATRDAQIQEKKQIQEELAEEEKRLDAMMEAERHKAMETEKQIDELRKQQRVR